MLTALIFGDVVGKIGREALKKALPALKSEFAPDVVIANAENLAHGKGLNRTIIADLHEAGVDFFTSGNHIFHNPKGPREVWADPLLKDRLIRPYNFPDGTDGDGEKTLTLGKKRVLVVNLICRVFMGEPYANPFMAMEEILKKHEGESFDAVIVDLHGEATSERIAFGLHFDGRVSSVTGSHTHVPTADARILPKGTAYLTDIGMTGARLSVLGVAPEGPISRFVEGEAKPFEIPEEGAVDLNCAVVTIGDPTSPDGLRGTGVGKATKIELIQKIIE
jgi:metallophosphoesterase (TIGR00282 family)